MFVTYQNTDFIIKSVKIFIMKNGLKVEKGRVSTNYTAHQFHILKICSKEYVFHCKPTICNFEVNCV